MTEFQVYLWLMLDAVQGMVICVIFVVGVCLTVGTFMQDALLNEKEVSNTIKVATNTKKIIRDSFILMFICILSCLIPSTKQYAVIKVLPKITNNETIQTLEKDMPEMYKMMKEYFKDKLTVKPGIE